MVSLFLLQILSVETLPGADNNFQTSFSIHSEIWTHTSKFGSPQIVTTL